MQKIIYIPQVLGGISIQYLIGENAKDNFKIIDLANSNDIWFHVEDKPSCHVIAILSLESSMNKKDLQYIIKQGAVLCKQHSKYASDKNVPIIYTKIENVVKTDTPGMVNVSSTKRVVI